MAGNALRLTRFARWLKAGRLFEDIQKSSRAIDSVALRIAVRVRSSDGALTYTTLLTQNNEEVKLVQELLRHANSRITLDLYAEAGAPNKRLAQSKLLRMVLHKGEAGLTGTMTRIANSSQVLERNWRGRRDSNPRPLP